MLFTPDLHPANRHCYPKGSPFAGFTLKGKRTAFMGLDNTLGYTQTQTGPVLFGCNKFCCVTNALWNPSLYIVIHSASVIPAATGGHNYIKVMTNHLFPAVAKDHFSGLV